MAKAVAEVIDSQIVAENVGFLDNCFDNSFTLLSSLSVLKEYIAEEQNELSTSKITGSQPQKKTKIPLSNKSLGPDTTTCYNATVLTQHLEKNNEVNKSLKDWGLPNEIARKYEGKGIKEMFDWQVTCLSNPKVLMDCCNLVYSAPTSAGKTLVAEILTIKTLLERQKKVIIILPFVAIVREKMFYLQDILSSSGIRVEGFMGSQSPPGGLQAVHVAICTIEKANSLVNRLLDDGNISELGAVIVDELHLLGDPHRGYILELLLTKIKYVSSRLDEVQIQIVGMSATLPNLEVLAHWLEAELFITQFRPIPLDEFCLVGNKLYDKYGKCLSKIDDTKATVDDSDNVLKICLNTIKESCSVLIFCMTKNRCENLAQSIASSFFKLGCAGGEMGLVLRNELNSESISEVLEQLKNCPVGLDQIIKNAISFGVAYHHAGLTFDERDIIEGGFKSGAIRVLVATSTLSSGVNLPARKVIIRSPVFQRQPINILTYKQMIGRAGRMGKDVKGESILICTEAEKKIGFDLMMGALDPVKSCIESEDKYMRAVLEMIASQVACTKEELDLYSKCTLLFTQQETTSHSPLLDNTLEQLRNFELVRILTNGEETRYVASPLGKACLSSSMAPNDGLSLFCELQKARQCLVLETDLHLIYLVTPYSVSSQWGEIDWLHLLTLWESLTKAMKRVGELVGVQESFIIRCLRGTNKLNNVQKKMGIHKRFYTALALQDLVNEVPLSEVATKFQCARGFLQSLQQSAATFAGMVTVFCHQLGWKNMEMLISQFQDRLHFGIHSELLELMKLPSLNGMRARSLFDAGFETISSIASGEINLIENTLHKAVPFQSEKEREGDDSDDIRKRNKIKTIWITGCCGMTTKEAAENLINEARKYLEYEIGVTEIKWSKPANLNQTKPNTVTNTLVPYVKQESTDSRTTGVLQLAVENKITLKKEVLTNPNDFIDNHTQGSETNEIYHSANACRDKVEYFSINNQNTSGQKSSTKHEANDMIKSKVIYNSSSVVNELKNDVIEILSSPSNEITNTENSPSILKDEVIWDTINFTEASLQNITKTFAAEQFLSPNISFGETEEQCIKENHTDNNTATSKSVSVKDISLFSSEGDTSSLFEESLPLESVPSKLIDVNNTRIEKPLKLLKQETGSDFVSINSDTMLNEFKSPIIVDDDEDIKLVYDEENRAPISETDTTMNLSENIEVIESQEQYFSVVCDFKSPHKRRAATTCNKNTLQPSAKKIKIMQQSCNTVKDTNFSTMKLNCTDSKTFVLEVNKNKLKCYVLKGQDVFDNFHIIENIKEVSIYLDINKNTKVSNELIGSNIVHKARPSTIELNDVSLIIKGIALYFDKDKCIIIDIPSIKENFKLFRRRLSIWFERKVKLMLLCLKTAFVYIKRSFESDLPESCVDISLTEWLIDSDEKIPNMVCLTKKYCDIDLPTVHLKIDNRVKKFKNLNTFEDLCLKAWCVWTVAEKQERLVLEQYNYVCDTLSVEIQVSRILAKCEVFGLAVDKDLASKLLIDVKNSQETLQRKAYKICGYNFNFNSSKDVAKVLGMYKGRKVSTKKSVLTSHNSAMSSVIIFWRKLNSILTKTLYPLTEKACIYTTDNRINPSYTMYTCTGRISMHEPNLQSVPRTFSIPASYLNLGNAANDVIEFNCRNIFRAAPGFLLISADYCQLEMRILTHYSGDEVLTRIMRSDVDVFKSIAASWGNVDEDQVDDDLRQKAKQLCYGILYGMGNKTLSQHLDVTEMEAAVFMNTFYKTYPAVRAFTQSVIGECQRTGYVETLTKRRRYLPDINSNVVSKKSAAERQAVNTTVQGSAADIAKAAMCAIDNKTATDVFKPKLILQMHDELVYEVHEKSKHKFLILLKQVMEDTVRLNVPLPVKVRAGKTWGSLLEIKF